MGWLDPHPGVLLEPSGDAGPRGMVVHDRTRLTGRLRHFCPRPPIWGPRNSPGPCRPPASPAANRRLFSQTWTGSRLNRNP